VPAALRTFRPNDPMGEHREGRSVGATFGLFLGALLFVSAYTGYRWIKYREHVTARGKKGA
jgi:hypothetical protein